MKTLITIICLGLLLTGCSGYNLKQNQDNNNEQVSIKTSPQTQEELSNDEPQNIKGDLYYIKNTSTKNDKTYIEVDKIKWLDFSNNTCSTPPEVKADIPQCNPNGFLIQNSDLETKKYEVSPSANIQTTNFGQNSFANSKTSLQELNQNLVSQKEYFEFAPFIIQIENNVIMAIQEKYIP